MNQRSVSGKQKTRSNLQADLSFQQKVSKAMHQKKNMISKMSTQKTEGRALLSHRLSPFWKGKQHIHTQQSLLRPKSIKTISFTDEMVEEYNQSNHVYEGVCVNHTTKKAAFESKSDRNAVYCHQCAIKMVKNNKKIVGINSQSLMFKCLLDVQLEKIDTEQTQVRQMVDQYYSDLKHQFENIYVDYLEQKTLGPEIVNFGQFQEAKNISSKLYDILGSIQEIRFKFLPEQAKQNKKINLNIPRTSNDRHFNKQKDLSFDIALQSNRSLQQKADKKPDKYMRPRQNSDYLKKQKQQPRKMLKLR